MYKYWMNVKNKQPLWMTVRNRYNYGYNACLSPTTNVRRCYRTVFVACAALTMI